MSIRSTPVLVVALIIITILSYIPSLFGTFLWDDEDFVYANQYVKDFTISKFFTENAIAGRGKLSDYYRPIQLTVYALIHSLAGFNPFWYHLVSVLIHGLAGVSLYLFLRSLFKSHWLIPFASAVLFLIHPVQTESVSYISGLSDPLFVLFLFTSLTMYLKKDHYTWASPLSVLFLVLSILSKELGLVAVGIVTLLTLTIRKEKLKHDLPLLAVYWCIGIGYLTLRLGPLQFTSPQSLWQGSLYGSSVFIRMATFFHNFFVYLSLLVFPKDLFMERDETIRIATSFWNIWTAMFIVFQLSVLWCIWHLGKKKMFLYGSFLMSLAPFSGIMLINGIFYEHFLYLPMAFFWTLIVYLASQRLRPGTVGVLVVCLAVPFVLRSYARQREWVNPIRFYQQTLTHAPDSTRVINNLGMEYANAKNIDKAIEIYNKGISVDPSIPNYYHNLGNAYLVKGDVTMAETYYLKAIQTNPNFYFSYISLLNLYLKTHQQEKADTILSDALIRFPNDPTLVSLSGLILSQKRGKVQ